ncbi:hypothetical protein Pdw03_5547 [Penicillium digitatum]|uniref:Uncharacterized protein n=3 Tax=Penicillium digitatum TaxID=36651 RepID=K9GPD7_PEND2|nr:hypothetical protein PDIP_00240 [Penicillium digitatum Pd1]EKV16563.1 hypothetical protein PDIG_20360 [Penicillium digitatum PHI26]EKV22070.1 hypothetical protein PDIP_00240 [Penicillium digitatum Pd1]KAG0154354.1 hypothetical protein PDIDSM_1734 [Penicillium digitatum]QQK47912.1 hypothetical protein Pdw03_5547 [Penicillium digitatum]
MEATTNYLSLPAIAEFINAYEEKPTAENVKIMVSGLLTYAFDSNDGWVLKWQEDEDNNHSNCFIVKAIGDERSLQAIVKVILDTSGSIKENWDQSVPRLIDAPLPNERCWAIVFRGLKVRLYEYHRDQEPDERLVPCDFKIKDKIKHAVHIRKNADAVNNVLISIPNRVPEPLEEGEHGSPTLIDSATDTTNGSKVSLDVTLETAPVSGAYPELPSADPSTEASEEKTPTEADLVTAHEAAAQIKTAPHVDTATFQSKNMTVATGAQAKITPQSKAARLAKAATGIKGTTQTKSLTQVKPTAGVKNATQAKTNPQAKAALLAKGISGLKLTPKNTPAMENEY